MQSPVSWKFVPLPAKCEILRYAQDEGVQGNKAFCVKSRHTLFVPMQVKTGRQRGARRYILNGTHREGAHSKPACAPAPQ